MLSIRKSNRLFFDTFEGMARGSVEAAQVLESMFRNGADALGAYADQIKEIEHRCDHMAHDLVRELNRTFITPFDREDIHDLCSSIDDVVDLINSTASRAVLFGVGSEVPDAAALAGAIRRQSDLILDAVRHLKEPESILDRCRAIKELETEGDRLYREAMARLFERATDPIFVIKAKEIIERLEAATDAGDRIAIVLERIVLKSQ
jgi:uncharacterized protein Yka (UPF0111/DUF47 family)